jgi:transposase
MTQGRKTHLTISLTAAQRDTLQTWQRATTTPSGLLRRGRLLLLLAEGRSVSHIARVIGMARRHIYTWAARFIHQGINGLYDKPGRGRAPFLPRT